MKSIKARIIAFYQQCSSYNYSKHSCQRWCSREHIFKSLALASKPQVLENCPVLGSRTALFFEWLKFCRWAEKCFSRPIFLEIDRKKIFKTFFLGKHLHLYNTLSLILMYLSIISIFAVTD